GKSLAPARFGDGGSRGQSGSQKSAGPSRAPEKWTSPPGFDRAEYARGAVRVNEGGSELPCLLPRPRPSSPRPSSPAPSAPPPPGEEGVLAGTDCRKRRYRARSHSQ